MKADSAKDLVLNDVERFEVSNKTSNKSPERSPHPEELEQDLSRSVGQVAFSGARR